MDDDPAEVPVEAEPRPKEKKEKDKKEKKNKKKKKDKKELVTEDGNGDALDADASGSKEDKKSKKSKKEKKEGKGKSEKQTEEGGETDILDPVASDAEQETRRSVGSILASEDFVGVEIEESPNDALSPQGEQAIDEELSPGAPADTDGDGFEKKSKKEKKNKKEKKEKKRKKSDVVEAEDGRKMPSPDEPKNGADGSGEMGETNPLMDETDGLAPEDIEEIVLRGPIKLGAGDDLNIPERANPIPKRLTLTGKETVRKCTRCDLLWDGRLSTCPECRSPLMDSTLKVSELLSPSQRDFLKQAFMRYDVDRSGRLDGKELRMAVRELGWDSKQEVLDKWARLGGLQGLNLEEFENLIASGKLGKKTFKAVKGTASQAVKDEQQQMLQLAAGANLQFTTAGRQGRRMGLIPGKDEPALPSAQDVPAAATIPLGEGESVFAELPAHRKIELTEAWSFWDADHSGFLEPLEMLSATKGLGFHFPIEVIVAVCAKHGGGIDQENFVRVMSVQIKQRDQELGVWASSVLDFEFDLDFDMDEPETSTPAKKWKRELAKAELNLRRTSVTDSLFRWRNLICTSHATVGEYAIGIRLYFDLLMLLVIAFGVLTFMTLPFLLMCGAGTAGGPVLEQTDVVLSTLARYSVGNLNRSSAADATVHIMNEFIGSMSLLGVLLLFRFVIVKRATYASNARNLSNLAVQVRALPKDLGYHHLGYEELIREHFQTVAYERAVRMGTAHELDDQPVREVVMWRNYEGAVHGVLEQVELQARQQSINTELKFLEQKASEYRLSDELEHDLGYTAGGSVAPTAGRRQSTKGRQTMKIMKERQSTAVTGTNSIHEDGADYSAAVTAMAEKMYDRICSRSDGGKRLAKRQNYLLAQNDLIEEQILQIETDRALHSDLKPEEREVMGAFVVFWCERTRDAVLGQYGWSRSWCCRACCQPRRLRLKLPFEESSDNSEGPPDDEEIAFPLVVEPTQDPSLQLWQNMDVKPLLRTARSCVMGACRLMVMIIIFFVACFTGTTHIYYPILLPMQAAVWVVTNMTEPVVNLSGTPGCWRVCELELFSDVLCQNRLDPYMWVSSNGLPVGDDAGLRFVQDRNFAGGSVCHNNWQPANCWAPMNLSSMCRQPGKCPASASARRMGMEDNYPARSEESEELSRSTAVHGFNAEPRELSTPTCPWVAAGSYNTSLITYTIRYQSLFGSLGGSNAPKTLLKTALTTALGEEPNILAETSRLRRPYTFKVEPLKPEIDSQEVFGSCGDNPDAAVKLVKWLGLSGPGIEALTSCQDFARMGLLGVPYCSNLPKVFRCLCAKTCKCPCKTQVCDCEDPPNTTAELLPLNKSGTVFTWEAQISICSKDGNQLKILTCDFTDLFDANQLDATAATNAQTSLETLRLQGILPITIFGGPPSSQTCTTALPCPLGQVRCYNRFYESVCATRCDGFEECVNATDELGCRPCETVQCELPFGRCVDSLSGASACDECSNEATILSDAQRQLCKLLDVPAGQGALGSLQCNASICEALGAGCDPSELDFEPCRCLEARATLAQREAFGCLVRGNFSAALRPLEGLMSLHHFDAVKAKKLYDELDVINLECTNSEGSSGGCAVSSVDRIEGPALVLTGADWLQSLTAVSPPSLQAWHLWVKCTCTSCTLAGLLGGGTWFVDAGGYLATKSPTGSLWQPAGCAAVNDDVFHFVGFSLGPDGGEQLFQDGALCAQRAYDAATSAGWSSTSTVSVMFGWSSDSTLGIFTGEMDAAAIFSVERSLKEMRHDMTAASWRGEGPTFAQRYLAAACEDSRLANSTFLPCGREAEDLLDKEWACVQGDICGCFAKVKGKQEVQCSVACAGSTLRRTLPKLLEEQCSDQLQLTKSCQTDSDCNLLFPPFGSESKRVCDVATYKCTMATTYVLPQHLLEGKACIARARSSLPLKRWEAQYVLAALTKTNASLYLTVEVTDGCDLLDANVSADFVTAHDGSTAFTREDASFQTTVSTTSSTSTTTDNATTTTSVNAASSSPPPTTHTSTIFVPEGKLEVVSQFPNILVRAAGGVEQLTFKVNSTADTTGLEALITVASALQNSKGAYISDDPPDGLAYTDMKDEVPSLYSIVTTETMRDGASLVRNVSYAMIGTPIVSVTYQEPELCSSSEFECAPGVCAVCPSDVCLCDGWQDCENGGDEDIWGLLVQRNVTTTACELLRNLSLTNTSVNENGTVDGNDPCFGVSGYPCNGTKCIPMSQHCDGVEDCPGGEDEEGCPAMPEAEDNTTNVSGFQWIAAVFFSAQEVKCARLSQPDGIVAPEVRLMSCDLEAILPGTLDLAKAAGKPLPSPMRSPPATCRYMASIQTDTTRVGSDLPPFLKMDVDHVQGSAVFSEKQCSVGPELQNYEIIGLSTAELAYQSDPTSTIVLCYCIQRMYLEPKVMLALAQDDQRYTMCSEFTEMSQGNYHRSWIRVAVIVVFNELFEATIRGTSTTVRYKDETTRLVRHFKNLFWFWIVNTALMPALVSCTIPALWAWINRTLQIGTTPHGGISMREWHGWVGNVITLAMAFRVFIPQVPDLLSVWCRKCNRRRKARKTISQDDLKNLYVNPEFRIAEGFAEVTVTASIAMIFGPALPLLNVLAAASFLTRYLVDWFIFLRHCRRPAMYDEVIARVAVNHLLMALVFRSATSILVWVHPTLFASDVAGCSFDESDVSSLRAQYYQEIFGMFELFVNPTCNPGAWFFSFLPGLSAVVCLVILPNLTIVRSILMVLFRRCRSKTGYLYDDVVKARLQRRIVASYQPRVHPAYQSAFKLMDLTANFNEQGLTDSSESHASTDLASEPEPEEENLAVTIFGKEYEDMEYFKRLKKEKKREKKEKKEKKRQKESTDPFEDDEVNPYDLGAEEKHKKKKKEKKHKRGEDYTEAQAMSTLVDF